MVEPTGFGLEKLIDMEGKILLARNVLALIQ